MPGVATPGSSDWNRWGRTAWQTISP